MKTVWKFPFEMTDTVRIMMPAGAQLLHLETQHGVPCLWALVDPESEKVRRKFRLAGTGHPLPDDIGRHLGSFQLLEGNLVFHLFEEANETAD